MILKIKTSLLPLYNHPRFQVALQRKITNKSSEVNLTVLKVNWRVQSEIKKLQREIKNFTF